MTRACFSRMIIMGSMLLLQTSMTKASGWHDYTEASPAAVRAQTSRLAVSENKTDRLLAAELLGRFPLYFSSETYLSLVTQLVSDANSVVREQALSALFDVADGGLPTESREQQIKLLRNLEDFLKSIRSKPDYDIETIDTLLGRIGANSLFRKPVK